MSLILQGSTSGSITLQEPAVAGTTVLDLPATSGTLAIAGGALGTPTSGNLSNCTVDGTNLVGYRNVPQSGSDKTSSYTLTTGDVGEFVGVGSGGSIVIPNSHT